MRLLTLSLFVKFWRVAIRISDKLPKRAWNALLLLSLLLLCFFVNGQVKRYFCRQFNDSIRIEREVKPLAWNSIAINSSASDPVIKEISPIPQAIGSCLPLTITLRPGNSVSITFSSALSWSESQSNSYQWKTNSDFGASTHFGVDCLYSAARTYSAYNIQSNRVPPFLSGGIGDKPKIEQPKLDNPNSQIQKTTSEYYLIFWIYVVGTGTTSVCSFLTLILAWISHKRAMAEFILKQAEFALEKEHVANQKRIAQLQIEKLELENMLLRQEIEKGNSPPLIVLA